MQHELASSMPILYSYNKGFRAKSHHTAQVKMRTCQTTYEFPTPKLLTMESSISRMESTATAQAELKFKCSRCPRSFKRMEHLKRHRRIHDNTKRFVCPTCAKSFVRRYAHQPFSSSSASSSFWHKSDSGSDILHRHELIHTTVAGNPAETRRKRACFECAKARDRCTKGLPCLRCSSRSLYCAYPDVKHEVTTPTRIPSATVKSSELRAAPVASQQETPAPPDTPPWSSSPGHTVDEHRNSMVPDSHQTPTDPESIPATTDIQAAVLDTTSSIPSLPSTQAPFMFEGSYNNPGCWSTSTLDVESTQRQSDYSPTMASPISWLSNADTIDVGYDYLTGLGIGEYGPYPTSFSGIQDETLQCVVPAGTASSYTYCPWTSDPGTSRHQLIQSQGSYIEPGIPRQMPIYQLITQSSVEPAVSMYPESNPLLTASWNKNFIDQAPIVAQTTTVSPTPRAPSRAAAEQGPFWIPPLDDSSLPNAETYGCAAPEIHIETYGIMLQRFEALCTRAKASHTPFLSSDFPSLKTINLFIRLYFQHFDPIIPMIHAERLNLNSFWPLGLALSAIGSQYSHRPDLSFCSRPLHEFLRRSLAVEMESENWSQHVVPLAQSLVLSQIGVLYGSSSEAPPLIRAKHRTLIEIVETFGFLRLGTDNSSNIDTAELTTEDRWQRWLTDETKRRLGLSIWLLDSMSVYHFGQRPLLCFDSVRCELPYASLWAAKTAAEWADRFEFSTRAVNPTLPEAVGLLYSEGHLVCDLGEFGQLILLHGIYEESYRSRGNFARHISPTPPPATLYSKETLSSTATHNAMTTQQRGSLECIQAVTHASNIRLYHDDGSAHTSRLHLAMARVVLLVPYDSIQTLAESIASGNLQGTDASEAAWEVRRWVQRDEHSARTAVLHCGLAIRHIKKNSRNAFYEPVSVFLATLTMWAYSTYAARPQDYTQDSAAYPVHDDNIYSAQGPVNILREGKQVLASISSIWGHVQEYLSILQALENAA